MSVSLGVMSIPVRAESVKMMDYGIFNSCDSLTDVYYGGTRENWEAFSGNIGISTPIHFES